MDINRDDIAHNGDADEDDQVESGREHFKADDYFADLYTTENHDIASDHFESASQDQFTTADHDFASAAQNDLTTTDHYFASSSKVEFGVTSNQFTSSADYNFSSTARGCDVGVRSHISFICINTD